MKLSHGHWFDLVFLVTEDAMAMMRLEWWQFANNGEAMYLK